MKKKIKRVLIESLPVILFSALIMALVIYAWTEPSQAPPQGNVPAPINVGSTTQYKSGGLGVGGVIHGFSDAYFDGNVGIGTTNPSYKLDVAGDVNGQRLCIRGDCKDSWQLGGSSIPEVVEFTSAGTFTWQVPERVEKILVWAIAGGGGGGGGDYYAYGGGGGGGAGEFVLGEVLNVSPGEILTIIVGKGGTGGGIRAAGGNGENTVIKGSVSGTLLNLIGGGGGGGGTATPGKGGLYAQKGTVGVGVGGAGGYEGFLGEGDTPASDGASFIKVGGKGGGIGGGGGGAASPFGNGGDGGVFYRGRYSPPSPGFRGSGGGGGATLRGTGAPGGDGYVRIVYFK